MHILHAFLSTTVYGSSLGSPPLHVCPAFCFFSNTVVVCLLRYQTNLQESYKQDKGSGEHKFLRGVPMHRPQSREPFRQYHRNGIARYVISTSIFLPEGIYIREIEQRRAKSVGVLPWSVHQAQQQFFLERTTIEGGDLEETDRGQADNPQQCREPRSGVSFPRTCTLNLSPPQKGNFALINLSLFWIQCQLLETDGKSSWDWDWDWDKPELTGVLRRGCTIVTGCKKLHYSLMGCLVLSGL